MRAHLAFAILVVAACGGGSGGGSGTGAIGQQEAEEVCRADCQHDFDCGNETDVEACVTSCAADFVGWARADAVQIVFACFAALECNESDDACMNGVEPLPIHEEWEAGCRAELAECIPAEEIDGACSATPLPDATDSGFWRFIAPEIMEDVIACLDEAICDDRLTCVQTVLETNNIDF